MEQVLFGAEVLDPTFLEIMQPHLAGIDVHAARDGDDAGQGLLDRLPLRLEVVPDDAVRVRILRDLSERLDPALDPHGTITEAIAFAVDVLQVSSIVVCGHSSCGAMTAMLSGEHGNDEHLHTWLEHGDVTLRAFDEGRHPVALAAAEEGFGIVDQLSIVNVALQVQTLAAHPLVRARHRAGDLEVIGLFYDIGTAAALRVTPVGVDRLVEVAE